MIFFERSYSSYFTKTRYKSLDEGLHVKKEEKTMFLIVISVPLLRIASIQIFQPFVHYQNDRRCLSMER